MTDCFLKLYNSINSKNSKILGIRIHSILRFIIRSIANIFIPIYFYFTSKSTKYKIDQSNSNIPKLIVSLTSFPKRINRLWIVIETILRQTKKPDLIILWLSNQQFESLNDLPTRLLKMQDRGLKIVLVDDDFRSHKKYFYVLKNYPEDIVITIDDDIFYSKYLINALWKKHLEFPDAIICNYAFEIVRLDDGSIAPYEKWKQLKSETVPSTEVFFGSGGGTLFPPKSFHEDVLKKELFMNLCCHADDVWLNTMVRLNKKKIAKANLISTILPVQNKNDRTLATINLIEGQNDNQLAIVREFYMKNKNIDPFEKLD